MYAYVRLYEVRQVISSAHGSMQTGSWRCALLEYSECLVNREPLLSGDESGISTASCFWPSKLTEVLKVLSGIGQYII